MISHNLYSLEERTFEQFLNLKNKKQHPSVPLNGAQAPLERSQVNLDAAIAAIEQKNKQNQK